MNSPAVSIDPLGLTELKCAEIAGGVPMGGFCNPYGDPWFGGGGGDGGGGGGGGFGFSFAIQGGWDPCTSDFMLCGSLPTSPAQAVQSLWTDAFNLPTGLNCPQVGGLSDYICGGVSPIMDAQNNAGCEGNKPANPPANDIEKMFRVFRVIAHPADVIAVNASIFLASAGHMIAGGALIAGGCLEPTPFEPITCFAGVIAGTGAIGVGSGIGIYGIKFFKEQTLPAIKNWGCND
jgi:hypothetical protein